MKLKYKEYDIEFRRKAVFCIAIGTAFGLLVYGIFLFFHIDIYGWNLGLIFAPLAAGYAETIIANRMLDENLGAISAFILFIDTTIYSFILKNPTLGFNLITAGSIIVILQAAFPTLVNYIILVVLGGIISGFLKHLRYLARRIKKAIDNRPIFFWDSSNREIKTIVVPYFDEHESNKRLNSLDFFFLTSTDMKDRAHEIVGIYQSEVILEKDTNLVQLDPKLVEKKKLKNIKEGKDECLVKLAEQIKAEGGNGVIDLSINYSLIGLGGDNIQITAMGMGIFIK